MFLRLAAAIYVIYIVDILRRFLFIVLAYQHIRMYDLNSNNPNPVINYDGVSKNVTCVGFHEEGKWMYTGGEDNSARIWDLRFIVQVAF